MDSREEDPRVDACESPTSKQIEKDITEAINDGRLRPGTRLPTIKALADARGVPVFAVERAYRRLRERGMIASYAGAGTFVCGDTTDEKYRDYRYETHNGQTEEAIKDVIENAIRPGERLLGAKSLARELGVSRYSMKKIYKRLNDEGHLITQKWHGTRVSVSNDPLMQDQQTGHEETNDERLSADRKHSTFVNEIKRRLAIPPGLEIPPEKALSPSEKRIQFKNDVYDLITYLSNLEDASRGAVSTVETSFERKRYCSRLRLFSALIERSSDEKIQHLCLPERDPNQMNRDWKRKDPNDVIAQAKALDDAYQEMCRGYRKHVASHRGYRLPR
jgi:DNA-binding transcriptional regulator YhcF (GntR family)